MKRLHGRRAGRLERSRRLGARLIRAEGPGGLAVRLLPRRGLKERLAVLAADYGATDLVLPDGRRTPLGVAHFLEHVLFETAEGNASDLFSARGAYSNAWTDYGATAYVASAPDRWTENLRLLASFVLHPPFPPGKVEKERGIIVQELRMYRDSPGARLGENLHRALFRAHPARHDIAGTEASVRSIRRGDLARCHAAFYRPANLCLAVVGDLRIEEVLAPLEGSVPAGAPRTPPPHRLPAEPAAVRRARVTARMDVAQPQLLIGFKDPAPGSSGLPLLDRRIAAGLALALLFDRAAPLYQELYDQGLADEDFSFGYTSERGFAYASAGGRARDPEALRLGILGGIGRARRDGFTSEALDTAKRKALGGYLRAFDHPASLASALLGDRFLGIPPFAFPERLEACGMEKVRRALETCLDEARHAVSVILPRGV